MCWLSGDKIAVVGYDGHLPEMIPPQGDEKMEVLSEELSEKYLKVLLY